MDPNNKAVKVIRFFCQYAMEKAVEEWIEMLPGGKVAYMAYELGKGVYEILSNAEMMDRDAILEATSKLSDADIQLIAQELSNQQANQVAIQETLQTMRGLGQRFRGQTYIQAEALRQQINQTLLSGRQQISPQSFNAQQQTIGSQVAHALTLRSASQGNQSINAIFQANQAPKISGFELTGILGRGSYATVYLAIDQRKTPHQTCALKVGQIDEMVRFEREVKNMKAIKHPNVLSCLDSGTITHQGAWFYWISMENMRPITVQDLMRDFSTTTNHESKWILLEQIIAGLSALHQAGILHRDLKPANCLISERFEVKLSDFGLSKNLSQHDKDHTINSSQHYQALGTPSYMSPEQILGENVGLASDVWSFGVMVYEIFTGELPFQKANNPTALMANILKDEVRLDRIQNKVDQQLINLIRKCLEKDLQKRYANAVDLAKDFIAISQAEIQKINDAKFQAVWQKLLDQGMIETYAMDCIRNRRIQTMGVDDWRRIYPQIIVDFKRLGGILEQIKEMGVKETWESLAVMDVENARIKALEDLDRLIAERERDESERIKAVLARYSHDELLERLEEVSEIKKNSKRDLEVWARGKKQELADRFDRMGKVKGDILGKIKGVIRGSGVDVKKGFNSQGIQVEERKLVVSQEEIVEKIVDVEVVKKGWFWDSKVIEKKVVKEKVVEVVKIGFNMVYCPKGEFWMGNHELNVKMTNGFWMGESQVTQELWKSVMGWNPSSFKGSGKLPVENATWYDCLVFCNKLSELEKFKPCFTLSNIEKEGNQIKKANVEWNRNANGYRLPTEAEWEYCAKAGTGLTYSGSNKVSEVAWYDHNSGNKTHEVKTKKANGWGLYDMSGNVQEWCMDEYDSSAYQSRVNGIENPILWENSDCVRVVRGGSYRDPADRCRVALRSGRFASGYYGLGLRLLRCEP